MLCDRVIAAVLAGRDVQVIKQRLADVVDACQPVVG
jgi:hypothetical protein